jgi:ribosomal protein L20A (L18A)
MKKYEINGTFEKNGEKQKFASTITAENEKMAKEKILAQMGGKQKIKRNYITIKEIKVAE